MESLGLGVVFLVYVVVVLRRPAGPGRLGRAVPQCIRDLRDYIIVRTIEGCYTFHTGLYIYEVGVWCDIQKMNTLSNRKSINIEIR